MAETKGMGSCLIQLESGNPCGRQINDGEAIGTVISVSGPIVGHKRCADDYNRRTMVKQYQQKGAGGPMDTSNPKDMVENPTPLDASKIPDTADLSRVQMPPGVQPITDLPFEDDLGSPVSIPSPAPERNIYREGSHPSLDVPTRGNISGEPLTPDEREFIDAFRKGGSAAVAKLEQQWAQRQQSSVHCPHCGGQLIFEVGKA